MNNSGSSFISRNRAVTLGAAAALVACLGFLAKATLLHPAAPEAVEARPLPVVAVAPKTIREVIELSGEFRPYQEADLDAKVRGYVQKLNNDVGDAVKEGAVLGVLDVPELKDQLLGAEAAVAVARQQAEKARAQYGDDKAVYDRLAAVSKARPELIAQQDLDQAKARSDASLAAMTAAQAGVQQAIAERTRVHDTGAYTRIYAPFDGVITRRYVDEGALVGAPNGPAANNAVFHISELAKLRLVVMAPESAVPDITVGTKAEVSVSALDQAFSVAVSRASRQLTQDTRTMHVEFDFDNRDGKVAPGMYAQVALPLRQRDNVLAVPIGALRTRTASGATVYILKDSGQAEARQVKLGLVGPDDVEIVSGLKAGELVAVDVTPQVGDAVKYVAKRLDQG
jgi:RND family efflux transporter MFP subunit